MHATTDLNVVNVLFAIGIAVCASTALGCFIYGSITIRRVRGVTLAGIAACGIGMMLISISPAGAKIIGDRHEQIGLFLMGLLAFMVLPVDLIAGGLFGIKRERMLEQQTADSSTFQRN